MEEYKIIADLYDIFNPKEEIFDQRPFFEALAQKYSINTVLDAACGTGWHVWMFSDMGLSPVGSDISSDMLALAKRNLEGKYLQLKVEDFRSLGKSWGDRYQMVTCLTDSLPYMLTDEDVITALESMYDRVADGGILVVSNGITDSLLDRKPKFIPARVLRNEAFYLIAEYPNEEQFSFNILYVVKTEESFAHRFTTMTYNAMRKSTLERCFKQTQFRNIQYYGDYDFSEYSTESSSKLIVVAEK
jgi:glycine/sarcosine N-methyltransferase